MERQDPGTARPASPAEAGRSTLSVASRRLVRAFPWHVRSFVAANVALNAINALTGAPWWAFWPLAATAFALAVHYFVYKAASVDERWVEERVDELNLKSYDRSHIEDLKARYDGKSNTGNRQS